MNVIFELSGNNSFSSSEPLQNTKCFDRLQSVSAFIVKKSSYAASNDELMFLLMI